MSFGTIAPFYRALETLVFGGTLQRARTAMLAQIRPPQRALIAGEGNGRFLAEFLRSYPSCEVTCVDGSQRMLALARSRVGAASSSVRFVQADVLQPLPVTGGYDLIVTHFFLDCFDPAQQSLVVQQLAAAANPDAQWLLADFTIPTRGVRRYFARAFIALIYAFFRLTTQIATMRLHDPARWLAAEKFHLVARQLSCGGIVSSALWQRG